MIEKMFDQSKCVICDLNSIDKSTLKKRDNWTSKEIVRELELAGADCNFRGIFVYDVLGILVYEVFKHGKKSKKRGCLYRLGRSGMNVEQFLVNLFDISLSHRIVGIGWNKYLWAIRVYFEESNDGQTNIDDEVVEAFKKMMEACG